jgi:hypothetical protein
MAQGLFTVGFTLEEIQKIQAKAKALVLEGKTIMQWGEGGTSSQKQFTMPVEKVLDECRYALRRLDPDTYGRRVTRTVASFSGNF